MLELRPSCENCNAPLPPDSAEAKICTFECTFCSNCVEEVFKNICPNCGGGFVPRPIRPANLLANYPPTSKVTFKPVRTIDGMVFKNSSKSDIEEIFRLYHIATEYMKDRSVVIWPKFEREMVEKEIAENKQWKMLINGKIACVWATAYRDPQIWEERDIDPAVYIHRIAVNPDFRGQKLTNKIVEWAKGHAKDLNYKYVRLDTVGENQPLIRHYVGAGFDFLGMFKLKDPTGLPAHYLVDRAALFQLEV